MKFIANLFRILLGLVFIFSGFVKGIDPLGSEYKFIDYFNAFGMGGLNASALFFSFLLSGLEFVIGISLFLNIKIKGAAWGVWLFMLIFTPLTLILAIRNPVTDCGCFGEAFTLSNWQTFWKNVVLLLMAYVVFYRRKQFKSIYNFLEQTVLLLGSIIFIGCVEGYSYRHLPIIDFRPYAIGSHIPAEMEIPADAPRDEYRILLNYKNKNTGEIREFDEQNYPWQDTVNWEFHSSEQQLLQKGYEAPIHDFVIEHPQWGDITEEVLQDDNYTFLAVSYRIDKIVPAALERLNQLADYAQAKGYRFYGLTASGAEEIRQLQSAHPLHFDFCTTDEIQLKTMIRSNPGLLLLKKGTIIDKWGHRDLPAVDDLAGKDPLAYCLTEQQNITNRYVLYSLGLLFLLLLTFYTLKKYKRGGK